MKGFRFYEEFDSSYKKRKRIPQGNVLAVMPELARGDKVDAIGAVTFTPNSPVASCTAHIDYVRSRCRRISESRAREIHPRLFGVLDG